MTLDEINPFVRDASRMVWYWKNDDFSMSYDCRLFAIVNGEARLLTEKGEYVLHRGAVVFFNAGQKYRFFDAPDVASRYTIYVVNFDLTHERSNVVKFLQPVKPHSFNPDNILAKCDIPELGDQIIVEDAEVLLERIGEIVGEFRTQREHFRTRMSAIAADVLISLVRHAADNTTRGRLISEIKECVHSNYRARLTNEAIAKELGYHPYYLSRVFAESEGMSLRRYISDFRLRCAMQQLVTTDSSIGEIALECGFATASHFTAAFKAKYGRSPSEVRSIN